MPRRRKTQSPPEHHLDWVVVLRMLLGLEATVMRGTRKGPTAGERWVWYCSYVDLYGMDWTGTNLKARLEAACNAGTSRNWPVVTLDELITLLDTDSYHDGSILPDLSPRNRRRTT